MEDDETGGHRDQEITEEENEAVKEEVEVRNTMIALKACEGNACGGSEGTVHGDGNHRTKAFRLMGPL